MSNFDLDEVVDEFTDSIVALAKRCVVSERHIREMREEMQILRDTITRQAYAIKALQDKASE
jgi:hypothetical protein